MALDKEFTALMREALAPMLSKADDKVLLLSCIDWRYPERIADTMDDLGYEGRYYHLAMAGASHAVKHDAHWMKAFLDHLQFAVDIGHVTGVVILDHMDCKAFEIYEQVAPNSPEERQRHIDVAKLVVTLIEAVDESLAGNVQTLLLPKEEPPEPIAGKRSGRNRG